MKSRRTRNRALPERPFYREEEVERICEDALRSVALFPDSPSPVRIDRFIEKKFVAPRYEDLPEGVLGFTVFGSDGVQEVCVSRLLDDGGKVGERRVRTTLAHEGGHGLLHAHLFALQDMEPLFGDVTNPAKPKVMCRDEASVPARGPGYDGRWWEFQANTAMGCLLLPKALVEQGLERYLVSRGLLGLKILDPAKRNQASRELSDIFDVNPVVAKLRLEKLFPIAGSEQLAL